MIAHSLALCAALAFGVALAQAEPDPPPKRNNGIPYYKIFDEKEIKNYARGNFIASSPNNTLYFSNEDGVRTFDGTTWKQILATASAREKIRSVLWIDGEVYASSYNSIGRLEFLPGAGLSYRQINSEPLTNDASEFFAHIYGDAHKITFVGKRNIVTLDRQTDALATLPFDTWIKASFQVGEKLYVATDKDGLWKLEGERVETLRAFESFTGSRNIARAHVSPNGQIAFATLDGELYRIQNERPLPAFPAFRLQGRGDIADIAFVDDQRLAIAIAGYGVCIVDPQGHTLSRLDKRFDYRWSAIQALHVDQGGTLWTLFASTVGKILVQNPVSLVDERLRPALHYAKTTTHQGTTYLRASGKLLRPRHDADGQLDGYENAIPDNELNITLAVTAPDGIYVHAEDTSYLLNDSELVPIGANGQLDRLAPFLDDPNTLIGFSSKEIHLFRRDGTRLVLVSSIEHSAGLINTIGREQGGTFWLEIGLAKLGKAWIEDGQLRFRLYTEKDGLPSDWITVWEHEGRVIFTERTGIYRFRPETDSFAPSDEWESYFPRSAGSFHRAATDPSGNVWASFNRANHVLWKQPDGSYIKDEQSLAELGERYLHQFAFAPNGDATLVTATEMFHFDAALVGPAEAPRIYVAEVSNLESTRRHYLNDGTSLAAPRLELGADQASLAIRLATSHSATLAPPNFQYFLEGLSKEWSQWSQSNEIIFTNLDGGSYQLKIRARFGQSSLAPETSLSFSIKPHPFQTPLALIAIAAATIAALLGGYRYYSRHLKAANEKLEAMVAERTHQIELKSAELEKQARILEARNLVFASQSEQVQANAQELTSALVELHNAQDQLMNTSRKAGMAEVATNVLHNVGNVLNSINVAVLGLADSLDQRRVEKLVRLAELVDSQKDNLPAFFADSPRGRALPEYLKQLASVMQEDFAKYALEIDSMRENIEHVKKIIATQQAHAKTVDVFQEINLPELIDSAIMMIMGDVEHAVFEISREFDPNLRIVSDKHRILQMVANFVKNCKEAINEASPPLGMINISGRFEPGGSHVVIAIKDNGVGIEREHLQNIFTHGFTTKTDGHGFGMHSCANSAKVLGGYLVIESDGPMLGATVKLVLPVAPPRKDDAELGALASRSSR